MLTHLHDICCYQDTVLSTITAERIYEAVSVKEEEVILETLFFKCLACV